MMDKYEKRLAVSLEKAKFSKEVFSVLFETLEVYMASVRSMKDIYDWRKLLYKPHEVGKEDVDNIKRLVDEWNKKHPEAHDLTTSVYIKLITNSFGGGMLVGFLNGVNAKAFVEHTDALIKEAVEKKTLVSSAIEKTTMKVSDDGVISYMFYGIAAPLDSLYLPGIVTIAISPNGDKSECSHFCGASVTSECYSGTGELITYTMPLRHMED